MAFDSTTHTGEKSRAWHGVRALTPWFGSVNASSLDSFELQALMQHKSHETTRGYVNMTKRRNRAADIRFVQALPKMIEGADLDVG